MEAMSLEPSRPAASHTSAYVSIRQHTSRQAMSLEPSPSPPHPCQLIRERCASTYTRSSASAATISTIRPQTQWRSTVRA